MQLAVATGYRVVLSWLDHRQPDTLPLTAGQWCREQLQRLGLPVRVLVAREGAPFGDCYLPTKQIILLGEASYFKSDPSYWAIAAHEIGHALQRARLGWLQAALHLARRLADQLALIATACILVNLFYGLPTVDVVAQRLLLASICLGLVQLGDELYASGAGMRLLGGDDRLDGQQRLAAGLSLSAALATYVSGVLGRLILLVGFHAVRAVVERPLRLAAAAPLAGVRGVAVALLSVALLGRVVHLWRRRARPHAGDESFASLMWELPVAALLALVWNQSLGSASFVICVALAATAAPHVMGILWAPARLAGIGLSRFVQRRLGSRMRQEQSSRYRRMRHEGSAEVMAQMSEVVDLVREVTHNRALWTRHELYVLPLLAWLWLR
jgi:Zn-dependent membrane protease YugP